MQHLQHRRQQYDPRLRQQPPSRPQFIPASRSSVMPAVARHRQPTAKNVVTSFWKRVTTSLVDEFANLDETIAAKTKQGWNTIASQTSHININPLGRLNPTHKPQPTNNNRSNMAASGISPLQQNLQKILLSSSSP